MPRTKDDYAALAKRLESALRLRQPPIAICMTDVIPEGVPAFPGRVPAGCGF